jgi:hypothetical protein
MNGFRSDDEFTSRYQPSKDKSYPPYISQDFDIKTSPLTSDKNSKQQLNSKAAQPNMLSDLAAVVRSSSKDGQLMPGYRLRQKASSMFLF